MTSPGGFSSVSQNFKAQRKLRKPVRIKHRDYAETQLLGRKIGWTFEKKLGTSGFFLTVFCQEIRLIEKGMTWGEVFGPKTASKQCYLRTRYSLDCFKVQFSDFIPAMTALTVEEMFNTFNKKLEGIGTQILSTNYLINWGQSINDETNADSSRIVKICARLYSKDIWPVS